MGWWMVYACELVSSLRKNSRRFVANMRTFSKQKTWLMSADVDAAAKAKRKGPPFLQDMGNGVPSNANVSETPPSNATPKAPSALKASKATPPAAAAPSIDFAGMCGIACLCNGTACTRQ